MTPRALTLAMLAAALTLPASQVRPQTRGTSTFVADVCEEGLSDLSGMKELFGVTLKDRIDAFVSVGGGTGTAAHSPAEAFDSTDSWKGTERVLLLVIALAGR